MLRIFFLGLPQSFLFVGFLGEVFLVLLCACVSGYCCSLQARSRLTVGSLIFVIK